MVTLKSGYAVIGEIMQMDRGKLTYRTDDMKTVFIDWTKVLRISSNDTQDILMRSGERHQGMLKDSGQDGKVVIATEEGPISADIPSIVMIIPFEAGFWRRFKGHISLGFDFQKAQTQKKLTSRSEIGYHWLKWRLKLEGDNYINTRDDADLISRNSVLLSYERLLPGDWSILGFFNLQQNDELSLDLRSTLGAGPGRYFVKNNLIELSGIVLLNLANEKYAGVEDSQRNLEAGFMLSFQAFRHHDPNLNLYADLSVMPNLTDWGRVRIEFKTGVDYEVLKDFYVTLHFFDQFDSRPPELANVSKNDYGMDISITWKLR